MKKINTHKPGIYRCDTKVIRHGADRLCDADEAGEELAWEDILTDEQIIACTWVLRLIAEEFGDSVEAAVEAFNILSVMPGVIHVEVTETTDDKGERVLDVDIQFHGEDFVGNNDQSGE